MTNIWLGEADCVRLIVRSVSLSTTVGQSEETETEWMVVCLFLGSVCFFCSVDFQKRPDRLPDVGRDLQIVCDKQIVGADGLFANRELRDFSFTEH